MRKSLFLIVGAAVFTSCISAQLKRPMTFEDMMNMKRLGDTAVSKDGKWLAYSVTIVDLEKNTKTPELWLQKIAGGDPIKFTVGQPGDDGAQFAPDGRHILYLSSRAGSQQVWIADFDEDTGTASNPRLLTKIATEADNAQWSPDGQSIVFTSAVYPDCPAITTSDFDTGNKCNADRDAAAAASKVKARIFTSLMFRHWNHYTGDKRSHLFLVSVNSGAMRDLNPGDTHDVPPFSIEESGCECNFSPDSKELAFTEKKVPDDATSTSASIFIIDLTDPKAKPLKVSTSAGGNFDPAYSPDGKYLAWRSQARAGYESDKFRLALYHRQHSSKSAREQAALPAINVLLAKFDRWVDEFAWGPDSKSLFFVSGDRGEEKIFQAALLEPLEAGPQGPLQAIAWGGTYSDISVISRRGGSQQWQIFANRATVNRPSEFASPHVGVFVAADPRSDSQISARNDSGSDFTQITHLNDALLSQLDMPKMQNFWFTAKDGTKLQGFIIPPPGYDPQKKYPVKFLIHGGPQGAWGDSWSYRWNAQLFAANGYVVVMINPRGSTGYGQAIIDGVNNDWGGKPFTDLMTGLDYAEQHYPFIDKTRECALGASYGGYMANWILGHTNRFKCIVSHDGMYDPVSAYGSTEELWFMEWEFRGKPWDYYGKPADQDPYRKWSPARAAINFKTPTLVIHSQLDYRLDVSQGFALFTTLQRLGVPSKMLYFPDEGHWVLKPQNSQLWYKTVSDWVDQWTGKAASSH